MKLKTIIQITVISLIIILIIPLIVYFIHFKSGDFSNSTSDWGTFSDYYNGILSPFLSAVNIVILIIITYKVQEWDNKRNEKALKHQSLIFKNELKYNAYKDFLRVFESIVAELSNFDKELPLRIMMKKISLISLKSQNSHLFISLGKDDTLIEEIADEISKLAGFLNQEIRKLTDMDDYDKIEAPIDEKFRVIIGKYELLLNKLQGELNID